ncbi:MAG: hypothetical protein ACYC2I_05135 [Elusimicrobiales bacterium]
MELIVALAAGAVVAAGLYLLFILLFLVRLTGNRTLWALALAFMRPVLREFYSYDLAEAANRVLQAQPDAIRLKPLAEVPWRDPARAGELRRGFEEMGFSAAGAHSVDVMPGVLIQFLLNGETAACIMEHPAAGVWADVFLGYPGHGGVTVSSGRDPGLPARLRRPGDFIEYRPGADPAALYDRLRALRRPEKALSLDAAGLAAFFEEYWALGTDWRKQHEFTPEEALAMKKGRALPPGSLKRARLFDLAGGGLAIANFFALVYFLFAARGYATLDGGPWLEALKWAAAPAAAFALAFAASLQAPGPVTRALAAVFMGIVALPFFWGTGYMGGTWYNCARDGGPAVVRRASVTGKNPGGRGERAHYAVLKSWRAGRESEKLHVSQEQYEVIIPGASEAEVTLKPGRLGHEWIAGLEFLGPGSLDKKARPH